MVSNTVRLETFLAKDFRPEQYANKLLKETTTAQDTKTDISSALARIKYDLEEIDERLENLCKNNTVELFEHVQNTQQVAEHIKSFRPVLDDVRGSINKLERDFLEPYNRASEIHSALTNLHKVAVISRNLSWYLQLALQAQSQDYKRGVISETNNSGVAILRNAQALNHLINLAAQVPKLLEIRAVSNFEKKIPQLKTDLIDEATKQIKTFDGLAPSQVKFAAMAALTLEIDLDDLLKTHINSMVSTTVQQLTRSSGLSISPELVLEDAKKRCETIKMLGMVNNEVISTMKPETTTSISPESTVDYFWTSVAAQLDQKLRTMAVTNQLAIKAMIAKKDEILACAEDLPYVHSVLIKYIHK